MLSQLYRKVKPHEAYELKLLRHQVYTLVLGTMLFPTRGPSRIVLPVALPESHLRCSFSPSYYPALPAPVTYRHVAPSVMIVTERSRVNGVIACVALQNSFIHSASTSVSPVIRESEGNTGNRNHASNV